MNVKLPKPLIFLVILSLLLSLACNLSSKATDVPEPTQAAQPVQNTPVPPTEEPSGGVSSLQDVKQAIIQIEAQGTFIDPEFGLMVNAAGRGSGFIIDPSGLAVTNNHVVTGSALIKVWVGGNTSQSYNARIIAVSECSDLALIDIDGDGFPYLEWSDETASVGFEVYAAGFPLGDPEFTLTKGIISKEKASGETSWASVDAVLEHDATINPGNSGGPLIDKDGKVVGVNYAGSSQTNQYFAIGRQVAIPLIDQLKAGSDIDSIGVNGQAVATEDGSLSGIWVSSVKSGSQADRAGVVAGDVITALEGLVLATDGTLSSYCDILRTHKATDTLSVEVLRWQTQEYLEGQLNGRELAVTSVLGPSEPTSNGGSEIDPNAIGDDYPSYVFVSDDTGTLSVEIPEAWVEVDGTEWSNTWGNLSFDAPSVSASASLDGYYNTYTESGVFFAASPRLGEIGGYIELLDGVRDWYNSDCELEGRYDYGKGEWEDPLYEGKFDLWENCGPDDTYVFVLAARPKVNPTSYLILLELKIVKDADVAALERIMASFQAAY